MPQSYLALQMPTSAQTGKAFSAHLQLLNHGEPVAGAVLAVKRTDSSGTVHDQGSITTDGDGRATFTTTLTKPDSVFYQFLFAGDPAHEATETETYVSAGQHSVTIAMSAPARAALDGAVTVGVRLVDAATGRGIPAMAVRLVRADLTGRHVVVDATTDSGGRISVVDRLHAGGTVRYDAVVRSTVSFVGGTASRTVAVSRLRPTISMLLAHPTTGYNGPSTVRVHLSHTVNRVVRVVATPHNGRPRLLAAKSVNSAGNLQVSTRVSKRTVITVSFAGDSRYAPVTASRTQYAAADVGFTMTGQAKVVNGVHVYDTGRMFGLVGSVHPYRYNVCMYFEGYYVQGGTTHGLGRSSCFRTSNSVARAFYRADTVGIRGVTYYFRSVFLGDYDNVATASGWVRARIS